jgi:uncharacterized membrane-anchored protein
MRSFKIGFHLLVLLQIVLLMSLLGFKELTIITGQQITLRTVPVDPWDMFRGEYVALRYGFSRLNEYDLSDWRHPDEVLGALQKGETVYVSMRRDGRFWEFESISRKMPETGTVFLRGTVTSYTPSHQAKNSHETSTEKRAEITYGIESYFVQHGTAIDLERKQQQRGNVLAVDVRVDRWGRAIIRNVRPEHTGGSGV